MTDKQKVINFVLSANAYRILIREAEQRRVPPSMVINELIMKHLLTTKQKVDDIMNKEWID